MRYIRTKDNIYILHHDNENENTLVKEVVVIKDGELTCLNKSKIIAQADTIEELCDEFVIKYKVFDKPIVHYNDTINSRELPRLKSILSCAEVYASVWVGTDLKAVAKMNEKGCLELL